MQNGSFNLMKKMINLIKNPHYRKWIKIYKTNRWTIKKEMAIKKKDLCKIKMNMPIKIRENIEKDQTVVV